jgi:hypothetical protein
MSPKEMYENLGDGLKHLAKLLVIVISVVGADQKEIKRRSQT